MEKHCRWRQATDDNMEKAHCMLDNKSYKYTRSGCVILIVFPLQKWLHELASMLCYTYIAYLVIILLKVIMFSYFIYFVTHRVVFWLLFIVYVILFSQFVFLGDWKL